MVPATLQALLGLTFMLALASPASAADPVQAEARLDVSLDVSSDTQVAPPPMPGDAGAAPAPLPPADAGLPDELRELAQQEPIVALDAQAHLQASSRGASATGRAAAPSGQATSLGEVGDIVRALPEPVREAAPPALAAAGAVALAQAFGWWRALGVAGVALYSRLSKSELLDNEHRDKVYKLVQEHPGISMSEVGERLGLGWGTVVYHLDRLERAGFVASERGGLARCFFPVGTVSRQSRELMSTLKAETTRSVAQFLTQRPGASQSDLCDSLGLSASAASKQVSKLEKAGLVRREREWKTVHLYPQPALASLLQPGEPVGATPGLAGAAAATAPGASPLAC